MGRPTKDEAVIYYRQRRTKLYKDLKNTYGLNAQLNIAIQELLELSIELTNIVRSRKTNNLLNELVDVSIVLEQIHLYLNVEKADFQEVFDRKFMRLEERHKERRL